MSQQLFITRKRKKWKFAQFNQWTNCFQVSHVSPELWATYFKHAQPLTVEIGAGRADLSVELARQRPEHNFVAVDIKSDRLYTGAKTALEEKLSNIAFVRAELRQMGELFVPGSIAELWLTFPDPFERKKHAKHRLTHPNFLQTYKQLLAPGGVLHFKTDNRELFLWSLEQLVAEDWKLHELNFDLHASDLPEAYKITTYYERKFMAEGTPINFVSCQPSILERYSIKVI